ncbi:MAG TPA: hypothetical protein VJ932_07205 [Alkalispirochaeta sp.]|nr:hypothetical protein [Alkalispirochaeta sp.]
MQTLGTITIYHLSRRDGTALFVHPLTKPGSMLQQAEHTDLTGRYGREPRVESITMLRNELYRRIDHDVRDWSNERRFIPRFLIAAGLFLVAYLFMALVIRDPLPIVDEILIGLGVGVFGFIIAGRRFEQSGAASRRRVALRAKVDSVIFSEDPFVHEVESILHIVENLPETAGEFSPELTDQAAALRRAYPAQTVELQEHLRHMIATSPYKSLAKQLRAGSIRPSMREKIDHGTVVPAAVHVFSLLQQSA